MAVVPLFTGRVTLEGQLKADEREKVHKHLRSLAGRPVEFTFRPLRSKRSIEQNRWLWGVAIKILANEWGYDRHERAELHYALVAKCFGTHLDRRLGVPVANVRSSKLSTKEFSDYMEWLVRFAAHEGIVIPLPDEVDLAAVEDSDLEDAA